MINPLFSTVPLVAGTSHTPYSLIPLFFSTETQGTQSYTEYHCLSMKIIPSTTLFIKVGVIAPALRRMMFLSAVNMRNGRINEAAGKEPDIKSSECNACANMSSDGWEVIWQSKISSPCRSNTNAGRLLLPDKSEKGKGMTTTSPFTNLSMPYPLLRLTNLLPRRFRWHNEFLFYRARRYFRKRCRPIHGQEPITSGCCF